MTTRVELIDQISTEMGLTTAEKNEFSRLIQAWEAATDTMAAIEPDGDYSEDAPLLPILDKQEDQYDSVFESASPRVKNAMDVYFDRRDLIDA